MFKDHWDGTLLDSGQLLIAILLKHLLQFIIERQILELISCKYICFLFHNYFFYLSWLLFLFFFEFLLDLLSFLMLSIFNFSSNYRSHLLIMLFILHFLNYFLLYYFLHFRFNLCI